MKSFEENDLNKFVSLANYTTWRVGGVAEWLAEPTNIDELNYLLQWKKKTSLPYQIIGAGSNLLINDGEIEGLSLCMKRLIGNDIDPQTGILEAFAGEPIPTLARRAAKAGLHGLEWSVGIPGTVGGVITMNAGAQGSCMADWVESVLVMDIDTQKQFRLNNREMLFDYRQSRLQDESLIVISARFQLEPGHERIKLTEITNQNLNHRLRTQPYNLPSCGSVFRNPEPLKAGRLIEELGLKGYQIGGAEVSKVHANFIVNSGGAKAADIFELIHFIQDQVLESHGLLLNPEVKRVGFKQNV